MPKAEKSARKAPTRRAARRTIPLALRSRLELDERQRALMRLRLARKLENFSWHIERVSVRFEDVNGPRGGVDALCRMKVVLRALPSVVVEERAAAPLVAFGRAAEAARRAVSRAVRRADRSAPLPRPRKRRGGTAASGAGATDRRRPPTTRRRPRRRRPQSPPANGVVAKW